MYAYIHVFFKIKILLYAYITIHGIHHPRNIQIVPICMYIYVQIYMMICMCATHTYMVHITCVHTVHTYIMAHASFFKPAPLMKYMLRKWRLTHLLKVLGQKANIESYNHLPALPLLDHFLFVG